MRLCTNCHRITLGEPLFCSFCGRTYDVKLCHEHRHPNPRNARVCSQCGSTDFTTPQPKPALLLRPLIFLLSVLPGLLLLLISALFLVSFFQALISSPQLLGQFLVAGLLLAILWLLYMQLPRFVRSGVHRLFGKSKSKDSSLGH
jgi:RNA polymerase subunit RPABC4/transcription elongation factor Spt4